MKPTLVEDKIEGDKIILDEVPTEDMPNALHLEHPNLESRNTTKLATAWIYKGQMEYLLPKGITAKDKPKVWIETKMWIETKIATNPATV
jgi:hypothetical protein